MNYNPVTREVVGSVDHSADVPTAPYVGCCGYIHDHSVYHGDRCECFTVGSVPDIEGRDQAGPTAPQELAQVANYGLGPVEVVRKVPVAGAWPDMSHVSYADADESRITPEDVRQRISERSMWALETIAERLTALVALFESDAAQ